MSPKTKKCFDEIAEFARMGHEIYPMFFSVSHGSATVSAAIRAAHKAGVIERAGLDGAGQTKWRAALPAATHTAPTRAQ